MTGLIWFVQLVHYPLYKRVGQQGFSHYQTQHARLTSYVVLLPMVLELVTGLALMWLRPAGVPLWQLYLSAGLIGLIWLSTAVLQMPQHSSLMNGFNERAHSLLVQTNWLRTIAWSLRSLLVLGWLQLQLS